MLREFFNFLMRGDPAAICLVLLGLFGLAVTFERVRSLYFRYAIDDHQFMKQIKTFIVADKIEEAIAFCSSQGQPLLPKVIRSILTRADRDDENIKTAQDIAAMEIVPMVTRRLGYLAMVSNVATLVGLLGTIHGLIQSFQAVSFADPAQKQTLLAQGISVSMNTTALGLVVAIPFMVAYAFLQARQNKLLEEVISCSAKTVDLLISRNYHGFSEDTAFPTETNNVALKGAGHSKRKAA
jgi:biopolymer transport protein ExbB